MHWPVVFIFLLHFVFFEPTEELLSVGRQVLNNSDGSCHENDLVVILTELEARFAPVPSESINMVNLVSMVWGFRNASQLSVGRDFLVDELEEVLSLSSCHSSRL